VANESKLLRVGSVEHRNRNHPLDRVILSGLSVEHIGVKFLERLKQKRDISIARSDKRTTFGIKGSSTTQEDRDDVTVGGAVNCSIVRVD
jgi:hypothetical protein